MVTAGSGLRRTMRWLVGLVFVVGFGSALSACGPSFAVTVNSTVDTHDAVPGDGSCDDGAGRCSLRAAIEEVNAQGLDADITVPSGTYNLVRGRLIVSPGSHTVFVHAPQPGALIDVNGANTGISLNSGASTFWGIGVTGAAGSGIVAHAGADVHLAGISSHGNGKGLTIDAGATVGVAISTFADNAAEGIADNGTLDATSITVTANHGGITGSAAPMLTRSIVADQLSGANCATAATTGGFNLVSDSTCVPAAGTDLANSPDARLGALSAGNLAAHEPGVGSAAIDSIPAPCPGGDQHGTTRPVGTGCDRGAIEADFATLSLTVDTGGDANDATPGDGVCDDGTGHCTLRAAVTETNAHPSAATHTITLAANPTLAIAPTGLNDNTSGDIDIFTNVTIAGANRTIAGSGADRIINHHAGHLTLTSATQITLFGGVVEDAGAAGGAIATDAQLTLDHTRFLVNRASGANAAGGALYGSATAAITITDSTFQANEANSNLEDGMRGGAIAVDGGSLAIVTTTIAGNHVSQGSGASGDGGAVATNAATTTITRSLITGNGAISNGGALYVVGGSTAVDESTITANSVTGSYWLPGTGTAIHAVGPVSLRHVTVTGNSTAKTAVAPLAGAQWATIAASIVVAVDAPACDAPAAGTGGYNIVPDHSCVLTGTGDQQGANPVLGPLAANGGPTLSILPFANSAAIDAIPSGAPGVCDASTPTDQRGVARPAGGSCDAGAVEGAGTALTTLQLTVNSGLDANDTNVGDGLCNDGAGHCTLRAAISETNARPTTDTVTIANGIDPVLTILGFDDTNLAGDLDITDFLTITGNTRTLDANQLDAAIEVHARSVTIDRLRITNGYGAVRSFGGTVTVTGSTFDANNGTAIRGTGTAIIVGSSTLAGNHPYDESGGIAADHGSVTVRNSTISGNTVTSTNAITVGSAIGTTAAPIDLVSVTLTGNVGAATIASDAAVSLAGSIVMPGATYHACSKAVTSSGHNVVADTSCALGAAGDQQGINPLLGPLAANGGPTQTHRPYRNSPAVNVIPVGTAGLCDATNPTDQRGMARPIASGCDAGAVEGAVAVITALQLTVNWPLDAVDANPGDGVCDDGAGHCTLRAAITETNIRPTTDTVTIAAGVNPELTISGPDEDANLTGDLDVTDWLMLHGNDSTIDANAIDRVLQTGGAGHVLIDHVTITGGRVAGTYDGGGALSNAATLVLDHVTATANIVAGSSGDGGAVETVGGDVTITDSSFTANQGPTNSSVVGQVCYTPVQPQPHCTLTVVDSTVAGNQGVGIAADADSDGLVIASTRVTGNTGMGVYMGAPGSIDRSTIDANGGYGVYAIPFAGAFTMTDSTVTGNAGGSALYATGLGGSTTTVRASTLVDVQSAVTIYNSPVTMVATVLRAPLGTTCVSNGFAGGVNSGGYNVAGDQSCKSGFISNPTDRWSVPVMIQPLASNGGPTPTHLPYLSSPAVDLIPPGTPGLCDGSTPTDQRGVARPQGAGCDAGAVEGSAGASPAVAATVDSGLDTHDAVIGDGACLDGAGACTLRAAVDEANALGAAATITITPGVNPTSSLAGGPEDANASGDIDIRSFVTIHGNDAIIDGADLGRVLHLVAGSLTADHLTVTNGTGDSVENSGGGIAAIGGSLVLDHVTVTGNTLIDVNNQPSGAGIYATGTDFTMTNSAVTANSGIGTSASGGGIELAGCDGATITDSTISGNTLPSGGSGGGIYVDHDGVTGLGSLTVGRSTISGNSVGTFASYGGGMFAGFQPVTIDNSTISGNAAFTGAGLIAYAALDLTLSTLAGNTGYSTVFGADGFGTGAAVTLAGTIISQGNGQACNGLVVSAGYNLATDATCALVAVGDHPSTPAQLGPLASNGGPTTTNLPAAASAAVDAIPVGTAGMCDGTNPVDQRGLPRPAGAACDIGAVER